MKRLGLLLAIFIAVGVNADTQKYDESVKIAELFCTANPECVQIISLELDSAYRMGVKEGSRKNANIENLINRRKKTLVAFCDNAPREDMCIAYRDTLMSRYVEGLIRK